MSLLAFLVEVETCKLVAMISIKGNGGMAAALTVVAALNASSAVADEAAGVVEAEALVGVETLAKSLAEAEAALTAENKAKDVAQTALTAAEQGVAEAAESMDAATEAVADASTKAQTFRNAATEAVVEATEAVAAAAAEIESAGSAVTTAKALVAAAEQAVNAAKKALGDAAASAVAASAVAAKAKLTADEKKQRDAEIARARKDSDGTALESLGFGPAFIFGVIDTDTGDGEDYKFKGRLALEIHFPVRRLSYKIRTIKRPSIADPTVLIDTLSYASHWEFSIYGAVYGLRDDELSGSVGVMLSRKHEDADGSSPRALNIGLGWIFHNEGGADAATRNGIGLIFSQSWGLL